MSKQSIVCQSGKRTSNSFVDQRSKVIERVTSKVKPKRGKKKLRYQH